MIYNPYPQVDLPFGKDNKYFKTLFDAIYNVDEHYIEYKLKSDNVSNDEMKKNHVERVFAYELYHQWGNKIADGGFPLVLNGEIDKVIESLPIGIEEGNSDKKSSLSTYPDLVLHHSQSDADNQMMICEIKRGINISGSLILGDLYKISRYISLLKFRYGVFILTKGNLKDIKSKVKETTTIKYGKDRKQYKDIKEEILNDSSRIVCVTYDGSLLEYNTLKTIMAGKTQNKKREKMKL